MPGVAPVAVFGIGKGKCMSVKRTTKQKKIKLPNNCNDASVPESLLPEQETASLWHDPFAHILLIIAAGFIVYANTIGAPFVFDDFINITQNPAIKSMNHFPTISRLLSLAVNDDLLNTIYLRPVSYFTFAVNYAVHGVNSFGYHVINLLLHICNAVLVYLLFSAIQTTPAMVDGVEADPAEEGNLWYLPLFAALIFVCHPVQTQSVSYMTQRFVPLVTFFYLGALLLYGIYRTSLSRRTRITAFTLSLAAAILAMGSKEIAFTLPVVMILYEFMFFDGNRSTRTLGLMPFLLTMTIIPVKLVQLSNTGYAHQTENLSAAIASRTAGKASAFEYLMTQFGVIVTYLRLLFFPVGQNLDYDYPLKTLFFSVDVILPLLLLLTIAGGGIYLLQHSGKNRYYRLIAFGIFWFFITLSVESSVVAINDLILEHRVYLPSIGFFMAVLTGTALLYRRFTGVEISASKGMTTGLVIVVVILTSTAINRNRVWQTSVNLWRDVVSKSPNNGRAHSNLGQALSPQQTDSPLIRSIEQVKLMQESTQEYREAIRLNPELLPAYTNLANALISQNKSDEALQVLATAERVEPKYAVTYIVRGKVYETQGNLHKAVQEYREAIRLQPFLQQAHVSLAHVLAIQGNTQEAIAELELVMRIYPDDTIKKLLEELKRK